MDRRTDTGVIIALESRFKQVLRSGDEKDAGLRPSCHTKFKLTEKESSIQIN